MQCQLILHRKAHHYPSESQGALLVLPAVQRGMRIASCRLVWLFPTVPLLRGLHMANSQWVSPLTTQTGLRVAWKWLSTGVALWSSNKRSPVTMRIWTWINWWLWPPGWIICWEPENPQQSTRPLLKIMPWSSTTTLGAAGEWNCSYFLNINCPENK